MILHARHRLTAAVLITAALFSFLLLIDALWIPAKAVLAQYLIGKSWDARISGQIESRPWPWADTQPTARLSIPHLKQEQYVLEGNSGRNLAFGPTLDPVSVGGHDLIIHGHRDTHFSMLDQLVPGDTLKLERLDSGRSLTIWYEVVQTEVVDSKLVEMVIDPGIERLSLVTCYPLRSALAAGNLRYVVTALPIEKS